MLLILRWMKLICCDRWLHVCRSSGEDSFACRLIACKLIISARTRARRISRIFSPVSR